MEKPTQLMKRKNYLLKTGLDLHLNSRIFMNTADPNP